MSGPLTGTTVIDFTRVLSGPYCTMVLADFGARVLKIEHPVRGDDTRHWGPPFIGAESAYFLSINRNKESVTLDFKHPDGKAALDRLLATADVVVENFRPGTLDAAGFGAAEMMKKYSRLIYCSVSGYGQTGPRRNEPGYDAVMQAEGGLMSITGAHDGPPFRLGVAITDIVSGLFAAQGVLAALVARHTTGRGQQVDIGMLDATAALLTYQAGNYFTTGDVPARMGNRHPTIVPYESFATADGDLVIAGGNDEIWRRLCGVLELPAMAADARFTTNRDRVAHYEVLKPQLDTVFRRRTRAEWVTRLQAAGVPCGSVREINEVLADPQLAARGMVAEVDHPTAGRAKVIASPVKLSDTPASVRTAPPILGQHTAAVLAELGYDRNAIATMKDAGVI
ncbi:MAG TPA: CoA transferase [Vicinamibacterales bacterium]|nr:CoA transferase [Vicinamibacterales bacterium]